MNLRERLPDSAAVLEFLSRYKYVLAVIAVGLVILLLPFGRETEQEVPEETGLVGDEDTFDLPAMEQRLGSILSQVDGAGEVSVMLTLQTGMEQVLAADRSATVSGADSKVEEKTVILDGDDGEEAVVRTRRYPEFQGALVVCPGGADPEVRLQITQAVSALTGLGSDRITVCPGS